MQKTIRFGDLVRNYGRPEPMTLWTDPKHDPRISKAIRENRVLTVHQEPTSKKKDFGEIGFHKIPFAAYFVFPKPLKEDKTARVVGINYQLAEEAEPIGKPVREITKEQGGRKGRAARPAKKVEPKAEKPEIRKEPPLKSYDVLLRRTATVETTITVKAEEEARAKEMALKKIKGKRFELSKAVVKDEVLGGQW